MKIRSFLAALMAVIMCAACAGPAWAATAKQNAMANGVNQLNWTLFDAMYGKKNLFYSPYSIESALALADAGAGGNTKKQMESVMGVSNLDDFLKDYNTYRTRKQPDSAKLTTANGVWINTNQMGMNDLRRDYRRTVQTQMGATVKAEPFSALTSSEISRWVRQTTNGFISDYKPRVSNDSVVDLINAIYFYGEWASPFQAASTYKQAFTGVDGVKRNVDMMHQGEGFMRYYADKQFRGLELPYKNGEIVMDVVLPAGGAREGAAQDGATPQSTAGDAASSKAASTTRGGSTKARKSAPKSRYKLVAGTKGASTGEGASAISASAATGAANAAASLDVASQWAKLSPAKRTAFLSALDQAETQPIRELALPKFTFDNTLNSLPDILQKVGMTDAFDPAKANFDNMAHGLYLSDIQHRAKIQVDEQGSKAAAVTEIAMERAMLMPQGSITFRCDQPFLYFIRDKNTGIVLFTGVVNVLK